jgi:hypothetical protein
VLVDKKVEMLQEIILPQTTIRNRKIVKSIEYCLQVQVKVLQVVARIINKATQMHQVVETMLHKPIHKTIMSSQTPKVTVMNNQITMPARTMLARTMIARKMIARKIPAKKMLKLPPMKNRTTEKGHLIR